MPTIKIREVDTSTAAASETTTNAVYIPGYAWQGPTLTPTLCETVREFQQIFGTTPYLFENTGTYSASGSDFSYSWTEGRPEPSYVLAYELLKQGLPVLFERMSSANGAASATITSTSEDNVGAITAAYQGVAGSYIYYTLYKEEVEIGENTHVGYSLYVGREAADEDEPGLNITEIPTTRTLFTFDQELNIAYPSYTLYEANETYLDNSKQVELTFGGVAYPDFSPSTSQLKEVETETNLVLSTSSDPEYTPAELYNYISDATKINKLKDRTEYVFKYLTLGGYPSYSGSDTSFIDNLLDIIVSTEQGRFDLTLLVDPVQGISAATAYNTLKGWISPKSTVEGEDPGTYVAAFTPWAIYKSSLLSTQITLPPSAAYLKALAQSIQTNANWYAVAGTQRGIIPDIVGVTEKISELEVNSLQPRDDISINVIQNVKPYGYLVWGNRTLKNNAKQQEQELTATSFLNIRQLSNDVKRAVYVACKRCTFEPDDNILWINFKSMITPLLDQMKGDRGVTDYRLRRLSTTKKATLVARITLYCIEAVEDFDITIELTDSQLTITQ